LLPSKLQNQLNLDREGTKRKERDINLCLLRHWALAQMAKTLSFHINIIKHGLIKMENFIQ
jgi:hypothetical protein